jgi:hypothetical protein
MTFCITIRKCDTQYNITPAKRHSMIMASGALFGAALHVEQVGLKKSKRYPGEYDIFARKLRQ